MAAINFREGIDHYVRSNQKVWAHDRSKSLGASEAFGCIRKAWFGKNKTEKDESYEDDWGALQRGDLIELHFVEPATRWFLEEMFEGARLIFGGSRQRTLIDEVSGLSATPDGLVIGADDDALSHYGIESLGGSGCFNFEIKSIDPRVNLKEEKAIHRGQTIVQMGLTREKTRYQPNYAVIIYIDASFFSDIEVFVVPFDKRTYEVAKKRARTVFETTDPAELMAEGRFEGGCAYCPYSVACARVTKSAFPVDDKTIANEMNTPSPLMEDFEARLREERTASAEYKAAEKRKAEASERLKQWFRDTGVRRAEAPGFAKASLSWTKGRTTYDVKAALADGVDLSPYAREGEGYDVLRISEKGPKSANDEGLD
jgi:CRISPR/Cas system-associated exonuclease Cas4 (RecB family)